MDKKTEGSLLPFLITCPIEFNDKMPLSVSLTSNACDNAENKLIIIDNQPPNGIKKSFGVCSKSLSFENRDFIIRFIEWVELLKILGANKITLFNFHVHSELYEIMNYFQEKGILEVSQFFEPGGMKTPAQKNSEFFLTAGA